jgi:protein gp37
MSDLFHKDVPFEFIAAVYGVAAACPQHTFQILTKRPERAAKFYDWIDESNRGMEVARCWAYTLRLTGIPDDAGDGLRSWPIPNIHLGTSCEDQDAADERIPHLLRCPAAVRFLSCEPLLGAIDLSGLLVEWHKTYGDEVRSKVHWVIVGGESGFGARSCDVGWIRSIVGQCRTAGVPCFVKQLGREPFGEIQAWPSHIKYHRAEGCPAGPRDWLRFRDPKGGDPAEWPEDLRVREFPRAEVRE